MTESPAAAGSPPPGAERGDIEEAPLEDGLIAGRPVEDRSFEVVEVGVGASLGVAIGAVVAGPLGAAAGGVIGAGVGLVAGEAIERRVGHAAETTDAAEHEEPARRPAGAVAPPGPLDTLRAELLALIAGEGAHLSFDEAVDDFPMDAVNRRPPNVPYTPWHLVEHVRRSQRDILDYVRSRAYVAPAWPEAYWPDADATATPEEWTATLAGYRADLAALHELVADPAVDLFAPLPGTPGHTLLREVRLAADHAAYHVGELAILRQVTGAWPPGRMP